ncbi:MAG: DNA alkylation repair protein [Candidatus Zixiibacteriota bacterium]
MTTKEVIARLKQLADTGHRERMANFGIAAGRNLGVSAPKLRALAKELGKNQKLATSLWNTRIHEARLLAAMISDPETITEEVLDRWVGEIDSWDICDGFCGGLVDKTPFAAAKVFEWTEREEQFVRRAGFVVIAALAVHDKRAPDSMLEQFFPLLIRHAGDERNFVKKALNWALREIGKRNPALNRKAIAVALKLRKQPSQSARWIAADALRELRSEAVQRRLGRRIER